MSKHVFRAEGPMAVALQQLVDASGRDPRVIEDLIKTLERRNSIDEAMLLSDYIQSIAPRLLEKGMYATQVARLADTFHSFAKRGSKHKNLARVGTFRSVANKRVLLYWAQKSVSGDDPKFRGIGATIMERLASCMLEDGVLLH
ncbi:hypothetical protein GW943_02315 [Candidatus Parcubacteria bacterium]|uniref:Uncharacterized protein n=1 Tax=Candidatus Kaiserbacteria bacterium CG10_big_fil_rev_8_21_14_0_10_47_16 TaxID=1974608 RepID=A0A2H0UFR8_9BACT|nr:hypothetical protein [Candidatus Parcubacteria bacterium]PIR84526.1 MAG: hypothetical protein COU16_03035 [Candidatus Kaiserbacteria bacterium CG10_big_fil_rev_8_21_14_0_10_47_16]